MHAFSFSFGRERKADSRHSILLLPHLALSGSSCTRALFTSPAAREEWVKRHSPHLLGRRRRRGGRRQEGAVFLPLLCVFHSFSPTYSTTRARTAHPLPDHMHCGVPFTIPSDPQFSKTALFAPPSRRHLYPGMADTYFFYSLSPHVALAAGAGRGGPCLSFFLE